MKSKLIILSGLVSGFWLLLGALVVAPPAWAGSRQNSPTAGGTIITVTTALDDFTVNGNCTLREAIQAANTDAAVDACPAGHGTDTIRLPRTTYSLTVTGSETSTEAKNSVDDLDIVSSVTLTPTACVGPGCLAEPVIQSGSGWNHRLLQISGPASVTLANLKFQHAHGTGDGGALFNLSATVTLLGSTFYSNTAALGGGIYNQGDLTLDSSIVDGNAATTTDGGGIYNASGTLTLVGSSVESNTAPDTAGIFLGGGRLSMTNGAIRGNLSSTPASALNISTGLTATLTGVDISHNNHDGVDAAAGSVLTVTGSTVSDNIQTGIGEGNGRLVVSNTTVSGNATGLFIFNGTALVTGSVFTGNVGSGNGGGLDVNGGATTVLDSTIANNRANGGGGLFVFAGAVTLISTTVSGNTSTALGGGIWNDDNGRLTVVDSAILSNVATDGGGGIEAGGEVTLTNSTVSGNRTNSGGGGIDAFGVTHLSYDTITNNTADDNADGTGDGGGVDGGANFALGTLIAGNVDKSPGSQAPDCYPTLHSYGRNLIQNAANCPITGTLTGNIIGLNPKLGPLQNNGGPTWTQALLSGSPAIDTGFGPNCFDLQSITLKTDQRGQPRPQGHACDIGAYESAFVVVFRHLYLPLIFR